MPWIRILGELPEPVQYKLMDETEPWQFTATYEGSFGYTPRAGGEELSGLGAYAAALKGQLCPAGVPRRRYVNRS